MGCGRFGPGFVSTPPMAADVREIAGVRITHPDRPIFPDARITKAALAQYYASIARWVVPHVEGRPLTLVRCPEGVTGGCFFMKHSNVWAPRALRRVDIQEKTKRGEYLVADSIEAVVSLVQMGIVEIHTWNSRASRVECPDRVVFDIDPGPQVTWDRVVEAARLVRDVLASIDLVSFPKTTGGRGVHVVVPLLPRADWSRCLAFARALAERLASYDSASFTTSFKKAGRENQILIDYLRNNRTNTSVAAFSPRAKPHAPVSMPLAWRELTSRLDPARFTVTSVPRRMARLRTDPWAGYADTSQRLTAAHVRAAAG